MKRVLLIFVLLASAVIVWLMLRQPEGPEEPARLRPAQPAGDELASPFSNVTVTVAAATSRAGAPDNPTPLLGETILREYANPKLPPESDLTLMSRLMENSLLLLKSAGNRPLSANEDWAALLRGENAAREKFLPEHHAALDAQGRLVDRWGTPLFFHALGGGRFELRSAGPDKILWTDDDIHRNANGSFRRGAELNSPSLLDAPLRPVAH